MINVQGAEDHHLQSILDLQQMNLAKNLDAETMAVQGFVTVEHDFDILKSMNDIHPHAIALDGDRVVGYALAMDKSFAANIPFLISLFERINEILLGDDPEDPLNYIVMGQVCIDKDYRSQGIFQKMHDNLRDRLSNTFTSIFTDVACKNTRSLRAHEKVGYQSVQVFEIDGAMWDVIQWKW